MSDAIRIGVFGVGTVGSGVIELLRENHAIIQKRVGKPVRVVKAVVANLAKKRSVDLTGIEMSDDPAHILDDSSIDIVLELIGGIDDAESIILAALKKGKAVVTANKALLAEKASSVFPCAYDTANYLGFEASVGAGIPIIRTLREGFSGDQIREMSGIMNGTANYILSRMTEEGIEFDVALAEAQRRGYAEADPTFDVEGIDTAHKLTVLMNLAFNGIFDFNSLHIEGITHITSADVEYARELGYKIKLLGKARVTARGIEGRVHPSLIKNDNMLASVNGVFNAIAVTGNYVGPTVLYGRGAGAHPTASAVVGDIVEACRFQLTEQKVPIAPLSVVREDLKTTRVMPIESIKSQYYLRFNVYDRLNVLSQIAKILGDNRISIHSVIQKGKSPESETPVAVIIITHKASEQDIQHALRIIDELPFVTAKTQLIRIDG